MRLLTYDGDGTARLGLLLTDRVVDAADAASLVGMDSLPEGMLAFIEQGAPALERARQVIDALSSDDDALARCSRPLAGVRLLAPIPRPRRNIVCVGLNYAQHAAESRVTEGLPEHPVYFTKPPTTVIGPEAPIPWHGHVSRRIDWEVELVAVIGQQGRDIPEGRALEHVFGYTVGNDITARDLQRRHQQWYKGKGLDGFCPLGPWIVTRDELPDPQDVRLRLRVNSVTKQDATTSDMIFPVAQLIATLSLGMTLEPGDLLMTGTPSGVGFAREPAEYLQPDDVVEAEIDGIGLLRNPVLERSEGMVADE
jgi:2-keto-4-pentenoate hydratase/2-oxohepta-3-ene-1,7-dioic acid hydratase in catechol pathway